MADGDVQLEARLEEQEEFEPPQEFVAQANVSDPGIYDEFEENWPDCWERAADLLDWDDDYDEVLDDSNPPFYEWFTGGKLNASYNCVDRHVENGRRSSPSSGRASRRGRRYTYTYRTSTGGQRVRGRPARPRRRGRRRRHALHADDSGTPHRHARLRPHRRAAHRRLRRLLGRRAGDADELRGLPSSSSPATATTAAATRSTTSTKPTRAERRRPRAWNAPSSPTG